MNRRISLIQSLIEKYVDCSYLEIGVAYGSLFRAVNPSHKVGVDPNPLFVDDAIVEKNSDDFFASTPAVPTYDVCFIDGWHEEKQVLRDVEGCLARLKPGGCIVLHDVMPSREEDQLPPPVGRNGNCWKAYRKIRARLDLDAAAGAFDHGCAVVIVRNNTDPQPLIPDDVELTWNDYHNHTWPRFMTLEEILRWVDVH